jgi:hypothetical protein
VLEEFDDYETFACTIDGKNVLEYDNADPATLEGKTLAEAMIDDEDL